MNETAGNRSNAKLPYVAVIILNWNGWRDTIECLESLQKIKSRNLKTEIIVCDNGSTDGSQEKLRNFPFLIPNSRFHFIENRANLGFAGGNNPGIKKALEDGTDYIWLLNNDTLIKDDGILEKLVLVGESDPKIGVLGPTIFHTDPPDEIWFGGGKINFGMTKAWHVRLSDSQFPISDVDYITGAAMLVKRRVIEKIGLMDDSYFLYYEDADWCLRAKKAGFRVVYVPEAKLWHKVSRSTNPGSRSYIYYHVRNGLTLAKKNGSFLIKIAAYLWSIWTLLKQPIKFLIPEKHEWALATTKGVLDFWRGKMGPY